MEKLPSQETLEQRQERIKLVVSRFLAEKLAEAVRIKKAALSKGEDPDIVWCLQRAWTENDGKPWQRKPRFTIPNLDEEIAFRFDEHSDYDPTNKILTLNIGDLRRAPTPEELDGTLTRTIESAYHEPEHIYNPGSPLEPTDIEETIAYLENSGEIAAHARQFAYRYMKEFPEEPFDIEKMRALAIRLKEEEQNNKYYNYFVAFADPARQEKYKKFGDLKAIHEKIAAATAEQMQRLSKK